MKVLKCTDCTGECIIKYSDKLPTFCPYDVYDNPEWKVIKMSGKQILYLYNVEKRMKEDEIWFKNADV